MRRFLRMGAAVATLCCGHGASAQTGPVPIDPASWITHEDYPADALEQGLFGTVEVAFTVDAVGRATACTTIKSSGSVQLDELTCAAMIARARFQPARDASGKAVAGTSLRRVRREKPYNADTYLILSAQRVRLTIGSGHKVEKCELWRSSDAASVPSPCDVVTGMMMLAAIWASERGPGVLDRIERTSIDGVPDIEFPPELAVDPDWTRTMHMKVDDRGRVTACRMVATDSKQTRCTGEQRFLAWPGRSPMLVRYRVSEAFRPSS